MTVVVALTYGLLAAGALLALLRLMRGPSLLDRVIAAEVILVIVTSGLGVFAAVDRDPTVVPVLVVVSPLGFLGAVAVSRYVGGMLIRSPRGEDAGPPRPAEERQARR